MLQAPSAGFGHHLMTGPTKTERPVMELMLATFSILSIAAFCELEGRRASGASAPDAGMAS
jgi:hypothetical protein